MIWIAGIVGVLLLSDASDGRGSFTLSEGVIGALLVTAALIAWVVQERQSR
ncbi:MAG TPA: hypothetical protein VGC63_05040 [Solirubrobacterales bacterium]|jgi:hypothetical protein